MEANGEGLGRIPGSTSAERGEETVPDSAADSSDEDSSTAESVED